MCFKHFGISQNTNQNSNWTFFKRKSNFRFSCCRTREEFFIHESVTTVGLILAMPPDSEIGVVECFNMTCKAAMERRGLKVNNGNMKILVSGRECDFVVCGHTVCCELGEMH